MVGEGRGAVATAPEAAGATPSAPGSADVGEAPPAPDRSWAAALALAISAAAGATALAVEAVRGPDRYYISAVIALDLMVAMVAAGLVGLALDGARSARRELAVGGVGTAAVALALRLQNRQLQASTKEVLLLLLAATVLTAIAAAPRLRADGRAHLTTAARVVGSAAAALALAMVAASVGDIAPVVHARGWGTLGALAVALVGLVVGTRRRLIFVGAFALATLGARLSVGIDGRPAARWLILLALTAAASWTSSEDRRRAASTVDARRQAGARRAERRRERRRTRRAEARQRRAERRAAIRPAPVHALSDLSPRARWMAGGLALVSVAVVVGVTARARHLGWYPIGDDATIATRAADVGGRHTPILGMPTSLGPTGPQGLDVRHPGPLLLWIYSPFVHLLGPVPGIMAGAAFVSLSSLGAASWAALRARGAVAGLLAYAFVLGVTLTASAGVPFEPLTAFAATLPLAATLVLAWAVASGVDRALAPTVVFASLCIQSYLPLAPTAAVAAGIALACATVPALRPAHRPQRERGALATAVVVGLVVWSGPLIDAARNRGGNLWRLATLDQAGAPAVGPSGSWEVLLRLTSVPPSWIEPVPFRADEAATFVTGGNVTGVIAIVAALLVVRARWSRWDLGVRRLVVVAGAAMLTGAATLSRLPSEFVFVYQVAWVSVTGAFGAFAALVALTAEADGPPRRFDRLRPLASGALVVGVAALLVSAAWPSQLSRYSSSAAGSQRAAGALEVQLGAGPRPGRPIAVFADGRSWEQVIANSVAMALEDRGRDIRVSPLIGEHWGTWRLAPQAPGDPVLIVSEGWSPGTPPVGRRIARVEPAGWDDGVHADRTAKRVADWARANGPITIRPGLGGLLRSVVAGWVPDLPCADLEALMAGERSLDDLPDGAIATLYLEGVVSTPALPPDLFDAVLRDVVATPTEVWLADASEARASIDGPLAGRCS